MDKDNKNITKLTTPYIALTGKSKFDYIDLWNEYAAEYNYGLDLRYQLRDAHKTLYFALLDILRTQIYKDNIALNRNENNLDYAVDPAEPYPFTVNSVYLMRILGVRSEKTVYNRLKRLIDARVIIKKGRGIFRDYILKINPSLVLLKSYAEPGFDPVFFIRQKKSKNENTTISETKAEKFTAVSVYTDNNFNKKISDVENAESGIRLSAHGFSFNQIQFSRYTPKQERRLTTLFAATPLLKFPCKQNVKKPQTKNDAAEQFSQKKEKSCAQKEKKAHTGWNGSRFSKDWWVELWVKQFYGLLIAHLFSKHNIYEFEKERTLEYLRAAFGTFKTVQQGVKLMAQYEWRIRAAARWVSAKNYDISNVYPYAYLTGERSAGKFSFDITRHYWLKHLNYIWDKEKRAKARQKQFDNQKKLQDVVTAYLQNPSLSAYRKAEMYVQKNIPHLIEQFYASVADNASINPKTNSYEKEKTTTGPKNEDAILFEAQK